MIDCILICAIVSICIYVVAVYMRRKTSTDDSDDEYDDYGFKEGIKNKKKKGKNSGSKNGVAADGEGSSPSNITPPTGVGATAPIFHQNITARSSALGEDLNMDAYESEYLGVLEDMTELMYRKALKSCLQYTDDKSDDALQRMNSYISTVANLKKISDWIENPDSPPASNAKTGGSSGSSSSSGWY
jgi:hypothetical protein